MTYFSGTTMRFTFMVLIEMSKQLLDQLPGNSFIHILKPSLGKNCNLCDDPGFSSSIIIR